MNGPIRTAAAFFATGLLAACAANPSTPYVPSRRTAPATAASPEGSLPGIDLSALDPAQRQAVAEWSQTAFTYCGAPRTVSESVRRGASCSHAPRMVQLAARLAGTGLEKEKLARAVTDYYASFDAMKRARLDVEPFGPPLGEPRAPIAIVEFSDFTCPFCQRFRPTLEKFVTDRPGRVRLHFKPYAIESHVNAMEAAVAVEWAREKGAFWKMHDTLFDNPFAADPDSLVLYAKELGLDAADLAAALRSERLVPRVRASMAEAKGAGIAGTPSLFVNGRLLRAFEFTEAALEFTLQDEEEWQRNGGWKRD